jgi:serine/threonine protein kinase
MQRLGKYTSSARSAAAAWARSTRRSIPSSTGRSPSRSSSASSTARARRGQGGRAVHPGGALAARLSKHPNIVSVYEADVADGATTSRWSSSGAGRSPSGARTDRSRSGQQIKVLRTVALAVHYAHEHGVLHRDLKPKNILVDDEQRPFVTDFGLARAEEHEDRIVCGSPAYISPEQAQALPGIDRRTDVYSLGVILYEILEGRPPFRESTRAATVKKVIHDPVPPLSSPRPRRGPSPPPTRRSRPSV